MGQHVVSRESETPTLPYEAPRIESVLEAGEVEREAHYAGGITDE